MRKLIYGLIATMLAVLPALTVGPVAGAKKPAPPPPNPWPVVWSTQTRLDATSIPKFVDQLSVLDATGKANGTFQTVDLTSPSEQINMREFKANVLPHDLVLPGNVPYSGTWAWGYLADFTAPFNVRDTYIGPLIVAQRGTPSQFKFVNSLPTTATVQAPAYNFSTDQSIHWANPNMVDKFVLNPFPPYDPQWIGNPNHYTGGIPATVHLHGAEDPAAIDGGPESWFLSDGSAVGKQFYSRGWDGINPQNYATYRFSNVQEAAPLWFHDHVLGVTRINVYMGLAGAYDIIDPNLVLPKGLAPLGFFRDYTNKDPNTPHTYAPEDLLIPLVI